MTFRARSSSGVTSCGKISQYTRDSRTRRAMSWTYCPPKSRTAMVSRFRPEAAPAVVSGLTRVFSISVLGRTREREGRKVERRHAVRAHLQPELLARDKECEPGADAERPAERVVIRLGESEVLHRVGDLAVLDREC